MRVKGEAFSERLRSYSDSTIILLVKAQDTLPLEKALMVGRIVAENESEEEVVRLIKELLASENLKKE